ncbi:MAG: Gfo/Idh/MocA family oxidoreductase [Flavobacteriaceae bacterium]|nr:Gfo/Idh/MocA family oxidoreductase [Flavobacteriaceae bacterium]
MEIQIKWGVLSTAWIATDFVIPAMLKSKYSKLIAIASRSEQKAKDIAEQFDIPKYYASYQDLLDDATIEVVYIPLPNHLHVDWAIKALRAGKHVLVEKPIALSSAEAQKLINEARKHPELKIMEAFMYKHHPQWIKVKSLIDSGEIGVLKTIQSSFSFFDDNPDSIVNQKKLGGGSLMDIGCYPISISRYLFEAEPKSVSATIEYDPITKVDILANGILEFEEGTCTFFSAIQLMEDQYVKIFGTEGYIEIEIPFNPKSDKPAKTWLVTEGVKREMEFEICDQYALQADVFSLAILEDKKVPTDLNDAVNNMKVIEKLMESDRLGKRIEM